MCRLCAMLNLGENPFVRPSQRPLYHSMGQYCFINIPDISQLAWHPFTISSTPNDTIVTHHIRSRGADQWTGRLSRLVQTVEGDQSLLERVVINVDGPYGVPIAADKYK